MSLYDDARALPGPRGIFNLPIDDDWLLVREYTATSEDGRPARVLVRRMPAQFFRLVSGDVTLVTGSGSEAADLVERIAYALAAGSVRFESSGGAVRLVASDRSNDGLIVAFERERSRGMIGVEGNE